MKTIEVLNSDVVIIKNLITTPGYATVDNKRRELTLLFINPTFLRKSYDNLLQDKAEETLGCALSPSNPLSPLEQPFSRQLCLIRHKIINVTRNNILFPLANQASLSVPIGPAY